MDRRVVITGTGVLSTLGDAPGALHTALCKGCSGLRPIGLFPTEGLVSQQAHELADFAPKDYLGKKNLRALDRTSQFVTAAAALALDHSGWTSELRREHEVGLVLGTMFCSVRTIAEFDRRGLTLGPSYVSPMDFANTVINAAAGQAAIWHDLRGVNSTIATGLTSGLQAIAYATDQIRSGQATVLLAGGAEELCFESFYGFERAGLLCASENGNGAYPIPFDARRNGLTLGEGAALLMLEDAESATTRGATILAEIKGHGSGYDLSRGTQKRTSIDAVSRAMRLALQDAGMDAAEIEGLSASANGSVRSDVNEAQAIAKVFGDHTANLPVTAIKSMLGETLGASGALQTLAFVESMRDGVLPGIRDLEYLETDIPLPMARSHNQQAMLRSGLISSVGLDGHCCALILSQYGGQ